MKRYSRSIGTLSVEEISLLEGKTVTVIGCGGLGGYNIEMLARMGVGQIKVVDGDIFDESNLNRQLFSKGDTLGREKTSVVKGRIDEVNPHVKIITYQDFLTEHNCEEICIGSDVIVDALDSIKSRFILQKIAEHLKIPLVHGAIKEWNGQVSTIFPGDRTFDTIYGELKDSGKPPSSNSFTPPLVASIQVSEVLKILINRGTLLRKKLLLIDTLNNDYNLIDL